MISLIMDGKDTISIEGFNFPKLYNDVPIEENLNYYLEKRFHEFKIVDFVSRRHPEIYPGHIGLRCSDDGSLYVVMWKHCTIDSFDEYAPGWYCYPVNNPGLYIPDILEFYLSEDKQFFNFISNRIRL